MIHAFHAWQSRLLPTNVDPATPHIFNFWIFNSSISHNFYTQKNPELPSYCLILPFQMPQVYGLQPGQRRGRSTSSASSASMSSVSTGSMRPTDADMLSDLVRTGEASRLRRRGAMRIDHSAFTSTSSRPYTTMRPASPAMPITDRRSWDSEYDPDSRRVLEGFHLFRNPMSRFSQIRPPSSRRHGLHDATAYLHLRDQPDEYVYTLVCGAKIMNFDLDDEVEPFKPSILPLYPPVASSSKKRIMDRSTGCGTIVHMDAVPRPRVGMWTARSAAPGSVITLEASYFDAREASKFARSACGCVKEGVGCAVWSVFLHASVYLRVRLTLWYSGNPLGIRYIPCKAASDSFSLPSNNRKLHSADASTRLRGPEGPQYWQASSWQSSTDHAIHTFFPHAVTSTPQYNYPPAKSFRRHRAYSDVSTELVMSPSAMTQTFPNGNEGDFYTDTEETNGVPGWDRLGEEYSRDTRQTTTRNHPNDEAMREISDIPRPEMILDRFSASSPISFAETADENIPVTNAVDRSWGFPVEYLRPHTRSAITPTSALNFRSLNDGNAQLHIQHDHEPFYEQQVLGAWESEWEMEEMDRARNVNNDGWSVSVLDARWGLDPDGESEVWGAVDAGRAVDLYDSESADKSTEGSFFPGR